MTATILIMGALIASMVSGGKLLVFLHTRGRGELGFRYLAPLTERELEGLADAYRDGASLVDLSLICHRSPQVVRRELAAFGVEIRPPSSSRGIDPYKFTGGRRWGP